MDCVHLSDAELLRLIWEGGETSRAALHELERRHFPAVRAFAAFGAVSPQAADELAYQAWQQALRQQAEGSVSGAVRAGALSAVLQTASAWARASGRAALNPHLAAWMEANSAVVPGSTAPGGFHRPSLAARAFAGIPCRSQTVLWHQVVERDESGLTGRLIGAGPGEVSVATGRAYEELYNSYVQVLLNGMRDECRLYHRLVLAYADARSTNVAAEVAPHLERCARCSRAVGDLGHLRHDPGALLAQALLPWGGPEYAVHSANQGGFHEDFTAGAGMAPTGAVAALPAGSLMPQGPVPGSHGGGSGGFGGRAVGKGRHAAAESAGAGAGARTTKRRTDLVVRCTAVAGVCAVGAAFAFGFVGDSDPGKPQSKEPASPVKASPSPSKTPGTLRATATAKSTSNPTRKPSSKPTRTQPAPPDAGSDRPSAPSVRNVAVEWLFDTVSDDGVTPDSSANNNAGTLFGASRPRPTPGGGLAFDGEQFVASNGPLIDTSGSFTVSAQVRLDRTDVSQTILSQDASDSSAFMLQYDADDSRFEMRMPQEDTGDAGSDADEAVSALEPQAGQSVHLTGVYDDADDQVRLYVNGQLAGTADHEDDFASGGNFVVGRGLSGNAFFQGLDGAVDDVRALGRAVSSAEAATLARES